MLSLARIGDVTVAGIVNEVGGLASRAELTHDGTPVDAENLRVIAEHKHLPFDSPIIAGLDRYSSENSELCEDHEGQEHHCKSNRQRSGKGSD